MASDTTIDFGNPLVEPIPQSGWQVESDCFGLLQAQVKFKWNIDRRGDFTTKFALGTKLSTLIIGVESTYANMGVWKANMTTDKNNVLTVTADFCGIDPAKNSGTKTDTQVVMTGATSSEAIEHHPNFLGVNMTAGTPNLDKQLANWPPVSGCDDNLTNNPNRALWTPKVANGGATQGSQFVGFLPTQSKAEYDAGNINIKAGVKNYYKPSNTLRCLFYVDNESSAVAYASYVGWVNNGLLYGLPETYRKLATTGYGGSFIYSDIWAAKIRKSFLITNCSVERFGGIWKITADLMLSGISGWDRDIYPQIDTPEPT
jgi:hypothetical protein